MKKLKVTLKKSTIGSTPKVRASVKCLGLKKLNKSVIVSNEPHNRGLVKKVIHLVSVEEVDA